MVTMVPRYIAVQVLWSHSFAHIVFFLFFFALQFCMLFQYFFYFIVHCAVLSDWLLTLPINPIATSPT